MEVGSRAKKQKGGHEARPCCQLWTVDAAVRDRRYRINPGPDESGLAKSARDQGRICVHETKIKKAGTEPGPFDFNPGDDRLSHAVTRAVPWALEGLTTVFEMGTGVAPPVRSPETC